MPPREPTNELYDLVEERPLSTLLPQQNNFNKHTQRGMGMLERSIGEVGWIGAGTMAANGEIFDGSARLEKADLLEEDAIVVKIDGTRPVYVMRTDIPTAQDQRAIKAGVLANRVAEVNLEWDVPLLVEANNEGLLDVDDYWLPYEQGELLTVGLDGDGENLGKEESEVSDQMPPVDGKVPLAIVLTQQEMFEWNQDKELLGYAMDGRAFREMWQQWKESKQAMVGPP